MATTNYGFVVPSLQASNLIWPQPRQQYTLILPNGIVMRNAGYNIQTQVVITAIMEWNIGAPFPSGQIRQTAQDRMDFAY